MAKEIKRVSYVPEGTIVNGVDVSDCCYIQEGAECEVYQTECEAQVCYYQQLKRKEQELQDLQAENEKLKEENKQYKNDIEGGAFCVTCTKENENNTLNAKLAILQKDYEIAQVNATRARKIGQKYVKILDEIGEFCSCYRENPVEGKAYDKILDIIKQAKGEE